MSVDQLLTESFYDTARALLDKKRELTDAELQEWTDFYEAVGVYSQRAVACLKAERFRREAQRMDGAKTLFD